MLFVFITYGWKLIYDFHFSPRSEHFLAHDKIASTFRLPIQIYKEAFWWAYLQDRADTPKTIEFILFVPRLIF